MNVAKILSTHGGNISAVDELGRTPLHSAAVSGNSEFAGWVIESQQSDVDYNELNHGVNVIDNNRQTPLHLAAERGEYFAMVELIKSSKIKLHFRL